MKKFSYRKFATWCKREGREIDSWAKECDGKPIIDDMYVIDDNGNIWYSCEEWEVKA